MVKPQDQSQLQAILAKLGISQRSIHRMRFGGVVGKQAYVCIGTIVGLISVVIKTNRPELQCGCLIGMFILGIYTITAMGFHGHKHPGEN